MTFLHNAIRAGRYGWLKQQMLAGADVNAVDQQGNTPLHLAVDRGVGWADAIDDLVARGATMNVINHRGQTPLEIGFRHQDLAFVKRLLEHGANPNIPFSNEQPALFQCVESVGWVQHEDQNNDALYAALTEAGADESATDRDGKTVAHIAAEKKRWDWLGRRSEHQVGLWMKRANNNGATPLECLPHDWLLPSEKKEEIVKRWAELYHDHEITVLMAQTGGETTQTKGLPRPRL